MGKTWLDRRFSAPLWVWLEIGLFSFGALALMYWARPADPLAMTGGFPWAWLAPVLLALRYGMASGLVSAALLVTGWLLLSHAGGLPEGVPLTTLLGALILIMICGEFSGLWRHRLRRQTEMNAYLDQRLEELTREHYLLKLSHDSLEQNLIARPYTLRGALIELNALLRETDGRDALPGAEPFLALVAAHCQLARAGLYPVNAGQASCRPVAVCGQAGDLDAGDPLVRHALDSLALAYVNQEEAAGHDDSRYLVVAPILRDNECAGLLAVENMPFFAFHQDTLQTLAALVSYYADSFGAGRALRLIERHPDCPPDFARNLVRLVDVQRASGVASHLARLDFPAARNGAAIRARLMKSKRELDIYWPLDVAEPAMLGLFPLTGEEGMQGYRARIDAWLEEEYGGDCEALDIGFRAEPIDPASVDVQLDALVMR